jgi:D-alanyl-D-alanine dipeptidase
MQRIIYIADPEILSIPIIECYEPLVDLKDFDDLTYGVPPECHLTAKNYTKVRKSVYDKLCIAQKMLPDGLKFRVYEGHRSLKVQQMLFDQEFNKISQIFPSWSYEEKFHETTRLVSPVTNLDGSINVPPHNTGAAIDIEIITESGELLDMGMTAHDWSKVNSELCMTHSKIISKEAQNNRKLLLTILEQQGFINYPNEWWHFSYGDRYWAYYQSDKQAIYGSIP